MVQKGLRRFFDDTAACIFLLDAHRFLFDSICLFATAALVGGFYPEEELPFYLFFGGRGLFCVLVALLNSYPPPCSAARRLVTFLEN